MEFLTKSAFSAICAMIILLFFMPFFQMIWHHLWIITISFFIASLAENLAVLGCYFFPDCSVSNHVSKFLLHVVNASKLIDMAVENAGLLNEQIKLKETNRVLLHKYQKEVKEKKLEMQKFLDQDENQKQRYNDRCADIYELKKEISNLEDTLARSHALNQSQRTKIKSLEDQSRSTTSYKQDQDFVRGYSAHQESLRDIFQFRTNVHRKAMECLDIRLQRSKEESNDLSAKLASCKKRKADFLERIEDLRGIDEMKSKIIKKLNKEKEELQYQFDQERKALEQSKAELSSTNTKLAAANKKVAGMAEKIEDLQGVHDSHLRNMKKLSTEKYELQNRFDSDKEALLQEIETHQKQKDILERQKDALQKETDTRRREIAALQVEIEILQGEKGTVQKDKDNLLQKNEILRKEKHVLYQENEVRQQERDILEANQNSLHIQKEMLQREEEIFERGDLEGREVSFEVVEAQTYVESSKERNEVQEVGQIMTDAPPSFRLDQHDEQPEIDPVPSTPPKSASSDQSHKHNEIDSIVSTPFRSNQEQSDQQHKAESDPDVSLRLLQDQDLHLDKPLPVLEVTAEPVLQPLQPQAGENKGQMMTQSPFESVIAPFESPKDQSGLQKTFKILSEDIQAQKAEVVVDNYAQSIAPPIDTKIDQDERRTTVETLLNNVEMPHSEVAMDLPTISLTRNTESIMPELNLESSMDIDTDSKLNSQNEFNFEVHSITNDFLGTKRLASILPIAEEMDTDHEMTSDVPTSTIVSIAPAFTSYNEETTMVDAADNDNNIDRAENPPLSNEDRDMEDIVDGEKDRNAGCKTIFPETPPQSDLSFSNGLSDLLQTHVPEQQASQPQPTGRRASDPETNSANEAVVFDEDLKMFIPVSDAELLGELFGEVDSDTEDDAKSIASDDVEFFNTIKKKSEKNSEDEIMEEHNPQNPVQEHKSVRREIGGLISKPSTLRDWLVQSCKAASGSIEADMTVSGTSSGPDYSSPSASPAYVNASDYASTLGDTEEDIAWLACREYSNRMLAEKREEEIERASKTEEVVKKTPPESGFFQNLMKKSFPDADETPSNTSPLLNSASLTTKIKEKDVRKGLKKEVVVPKASSKMPNCKSLTKNFLEAGRVRFETSPLTYVRPPPLESPTKPQIQEDANASDTDDSGLWDEACNEVQAELTRLDMIDNGQFADENTLAKRSIKVAKGMIRPRISQPIEPPSSAQQPATKTSSLPLLRDLELDLTPIQKKELLIATEAVEIHAESSTTEVSKPSLDVKYLYENGSETFAFCCTTLDKLEVWAWDLASKNAADLLDDSTQDGINFAQKHIQDLVDIFVRNPHNLDADDLVSFRDLVREHKMWRVLNDGATGVDLSRASGLADDFIMDEIEVPDTKTLENMQSIVQERRQILMAIFTEMYTLGKNNSANLGDAEFGLGTWWNFWREEQVARKNVGSLEDRGMKRSKRKAS